MCCDSWGRKESDTTEQLNLTELLRESFLNVEGELNSLFLKWHYVICTLENTQF